ncbi:hypothetical protein ACWCPI_38640 [Streptomyces sp. NPDC001920]
MGQRGYLGIADHGYAHGLGTAYSSNNLAFFPLHPVMVKAVAAVTPGTRASTGLALAVIASFVAAWGVFAVGDRLHDRQGAATSTGRQTHPPHQPTNTTRPAPPDHTDGTHPAPPDHTTQHAPPRPTTRRNTPRPARPHDGTRPAPPDHTAEHTPPDQPTTSRITNSAAPASAGPTTS